MAKKTTQQIQGYCEKCNAPVFLNNSDDQFGNTVITLNCWNGHYAWINIEGIESDLPVNSTTRVSESLIKKISFFKLP